MDETSSDDDLYATFAEELSFKKALDRTLTLKEVGKFLKEKLPALGGVVGPQTTRRRFGKIVKALQ